MFVHPYEKQSRLGVKVLLASVLVYWACAGLTVAQEQVEPGCETSVQLLEQMQSALSTATPTSPAPVPLNEKCNSHLAIAGAASALSKNSGTYRADQGVESLFDAALNGETGVSIQTSVKSEKSGSWSLGKIIGTVGGAAAVIGGGAVLADTIGDNPILAQQVINSMISGATSSQYENAPAPYSSLAQSSPPTTYGGAYSSSYEDEGEYYDDEEEGYQPSAAELILQGMNKGLQQSMPLIEDGRRREAERQAQYDADVQRQIDEYRAQQEYNARMILLQQQAVEQAREQQRTSQQSQQQSNSSGSGSCVDPPKKEGRNVSCQGYTYNCYRTDSGTLFCATN